MSKSESKGEPNLGYEQPPECTFEYDEAAKKATIRNATDELPPELFSRANDVEILDASDGMLSALPEEIAELPNLRVVFLSNHPFEEVPPVLGSCDKVEMIGMKSCNIKEVGVDSLPPGLRGLTLTDNLLETLPGSVGSLEKLEKLMLSGNSKLSYLPGELLDCQNLQVVRFAAYGLIEAPEWLFELPELAWYADAGNPYNGFSSESEGFLESISWNDLQIEKNKIGSSAINEVFRGKYRGQEVAIKKFGGAIGTDGLPDDELAACLRVGGKESSRVVGAFGHTVDSRDGRQVAVMPLLSSEFQAVGKPPDLRTLSRDVYPSGARFPEEFIVCSVKEVTAAMQHIHNRGVMHGDLYAHNILANGSGESYVTDFGAASIYDRERGQPNLREKIEVRALGNYIDELLKHRSESRTTEHLEGIRDQCLDKQVTNRPDFAEILDELT